MQEILLSILVAMYAVKSIVDYFQARDPENEKKQKIDREVERAVLLVEQVVRVSLGNKLTDEQKANLKNTAINMVVKNLDDKTIKYIETKIAKVRGISPEVKDYAKIYIGEAVEYTLSKIKNSL
jgi:light-regulated signal transduction histidine kinase (bacteriophytochrome)